MIFVNDSNKGKDADKIKEASFGRFMPLSIKRPPTKLIIRTAKRSKR
jgi:hypothetical protein